MSTADESVAFSPLASTSILLCGVTSIVLTRFLALPANVGAFLLRPFASFWPRGSMPRPGVDASGGSVPSSLPDECSLGEGGMKRSRSLVRLETADVQELPAAVLSAMTRASNHL